MSDKQPIPAPIHYQSTGELLPIDYNWVHLLNTCKAGIEQGKAYVILPVVEVFNTKKNKLRMIKEDKESPLGLVMKTDREAMEQYYPYAPVRFDIEQLAKYAAKKFGEASEEDIERMWKEMAQV